MNIKKIPEHIYRDLKSRELSDEDIEHCTPEQLFHDYCEWNGLRGWSDSLVTALDKLRDADA